jgi:hypothetical protein
LRVQSRHAVWPEEMRGEAMREEQQDARPLRRVWRQYVLGLGVGGAAALYGLVALLMGRTFLPGLTAPGHMATGRSGLAMALAYLLGGLYLLVRLFLEARARTNETRARLYALEIPILAGFIAATVYVLMHMGAVQ